MKRIILKFHIKSNGNRLYIEDEAKLDEYGDYEDKNFIYLKEGKVPKSLLDSEVESVLESDEGIGLEDSQVLL